MKVGILSILLTAALVSAEGPRENTGADQKIPRIVMPAVQRDKTFTISSTGAPMMKYTLQLSRDLATWNDIEVVYSVSNSFSFTKLSVDDAPQGFFRVKGEKADAIIF